MKKLLSSAIAIGFLLYSSIGNIAFAATMNANTSPSLNNAVGGSVSKSGNTTNVVVNSGRGGTSTYNWNNFNVGKNQTVNFEFKNHHQTAMNKVSASSGMSHIYGKITNDGVGKETGKIFLLNPNGVFFGDGASVSVNSLTVSSFDGKWDNAKQQLTLTRNGNAGNIIVGEGAKIHGAKGVNLIGNTVSTYKDSLISTNTNALADGNTYGKVKIVTGDGVTFQYLNTTDSSTGNLVSNGAVSGISGLKNSTSKSLITLQGNITAGSVEAVNTSTNANSNIFVNNAVIKATKAVKGEDGSITLTANSKVFVNNSQLSTVNRDTAAAADTSRAAKINISGAKGVTLTSSTLSGANGARTDAGNVTLTSSAGNVVVDKSNIATKGNVTLNAKSMASVQNQSVIGAKNIILNGDTGAQAVSSTLTATGGSIGLEAINGRALIHGTTAKASETISVSSTPNVAYINQSNIESKNVSVGGYASSQIANSTVKATGNIAVGSNGGTASISNSTVNTSGSVALNSGMQGNSIIDKSRVTASNDVVMSAGKISSIQNNSTVTGKSISMTGNAGAQTTNSTLTATNGNVYFSSNRGNAIVSNSSTVKASNNVILDADRAASVQYGANVEGKIVSITGKTLAQVNGGNAKATNGYVTIKSTNGSAAIVSGTVQATNGNIGVQSVNGNAIIDNATVKTNSDVVVEAGNIASVHRNANVEGSNVYVSAINNAQVLSGSKLTATSGNVQVKSTNAHAIVDNARLVASNNSIVRAGKIASVQNSSYVEGNSVTVLGNERSHISTDSTIRERISDTQ